jgi:hypothetical protein
MRSFSDAELDTVRRFLLTMTEVVLVDPTGPERGIGYQPGVTTGDGSDRHGSYGTVQAGASLL